MCPKTCNLHCFSSPSVADNVGHPACTPRFAKSNTPYGGVCVSRISVSRGTRLYISSRPNSQSAPKRMRNQNNLKGLSPSASASFSYWKEPIMNRGVACAKSDTHTTFEKRERAYRRPIDLPCFVARFQFHRFIL